jgi:hypothetical protein
MKSKKLFNAIVRYGFALSTSVGTGAACGGGSRPIREGVTPHPCEQMPCSVVGRVSDVDGTPIAGATVECLGRMTTTDAHGSYSLDISGYGGGDARVTAVARDGRETYGMLNAHGGEATVDIQFGVPSAGPLAPDAAPPEPGDGN